MTHIPDTELALYAGGDLGASESLPVAEHLERCAECRRRAEELRLAADWLRTVAVEPDAGQIYMLRESVRSATAPKVRWRLFAWLAAAAAAIVLVFFLLPRFKPVEKKSSLATALPPLPAAPGPVSPLVLPERPRQRAVTRARRVHKEPAPQLSLVARSNEDTPVIRVKTSDPSVVILWVVGNGSEQEKEQ